MKNKNIWFGLCLGVALSIGLVTQAEDFKTEEVRLEAVLTPSKGYDDNDTVEVILHGTLKNACYSIGNAEFERIGENKISVKQFARKLTTGVCADESKLPTHLLLQVPFTTELTLGQLGNGPYQVVYNQSFGNSAGVRDLVVARSKLPSVDELPYASVSAALTRDVYGPKDDVKVTINGVLTSSRMELNPVVQWEKVDDVYVVLPTVKVRNDVLCTYMLRPFQFNLNIGNSDPGHYLVHVRSMNGNSVNKVFEVPEIQ